MNIVDFSAYRDRVLQERPQLLDLSETRFSKVVGPLRPRWDPERIPGRAYRCHLVEDWLAWFKLPSNWKPRVLASRGIRNSLSTMFAQWAKVGHRVLIPEDVYPVYRKLANEAGLVTVTFNTLPRITSPENSIFVGDESKMPVYPPAEVLLVADPVKPRGDTLSDTEVQALLVWLSQSSERRVVVDMVYTFSPQLSAAVLSLLATDQTIVLHSLSKGWAAAEVFGVALVPEQDVEQWTPIFREMPTLCEADAGDVNAHTQRLKLAQLCLHPEIGGSFPEVLACRLNLAEKSLNAVWQSKGIEKSYGTDRDLTGSSVPRYIHAVPFRHDDLMREHGVLALPASVFGSTQTTWSVVSSLRYLL